MSTLNNEVQTLMDNGASEAEIAAFIKNKTPESEQVAAQEAVDEIKKAQTSQGDAAAESESTASDSEDGSLESTTDRYDRIIDSNEDLIINEYTNSVKYPGIGAQTTGSVLDEVQFTLPNGKQITVDLYDKAQYFTYDRDKELAKLKQIDDYYKAVDPKQAALMTPLSDRQVAGSGADFLDSDIALANKFYGAAGYNIKKGTKGFGSWTIEKDGIQVFEGEGGMGANNVQKYMFENISEEERLKMDKFAEQEKLKLIDKSKLKADAIVFTDEDITKHIGGNDGFTKGLELDFSAQGMPDADRAIISEYLNTPIKELKNVQAGSRSVRIPMPVDGWRNTKVAGLEDIRESLSPEGQLIFDETMKYRLENKTEEKSRAQAKKDMYAQKYATILEQDYKATESKAVQYSAETEVINLKEEEKTFEPKAKHLAENYKKSIEIHGNNIQATIDGGQKDEVQFKKVGKNIVVDRDYVPSYLQGGSTLNLSTGKRQRLDPNSLGTARLLNEYKKKQDKYQEELNKLDKEGKLYDNEYKTSSENLENEYKKWSKNVTDKSVLQGITNKEYDLSRVLAKDFGGGFNTMALSVPMLFGSEDAIKAYDQSNKGSERYETMLDYADAIQFGQKGRFSLRTVTQQAPNVIVALGTGAIGIPGMSSIGLTSQLATQMTIGSLFGVSAAGTTKGDLTILQNASNDAKVSLEELESVKDEIDRDSYITQKKQLLEVIAQGDFTNAQINGMSVAAGVTEFGISSFLGTVPNSLKTLGRFTGATDDIVSAVMRSNSRAALNAGWAGLKEVGSEIIEEELIWGVNGGFESLILGRDMDWSEWDDIAVTSVLTSGPMSGPGLAYSTVMTQISTAPVRNKLKADFENVDRILGEVQDLDANDPIVLEKLEEVSRIYSNISSNVDGLELDGLLLGSKGTKSVIQAGLRLDALDQQAGVDPRDSREVKLDKIQTHIDSLKAEDGDKFSKEYKLAKEQKQKAIESIDYKGATKKLFGERGLEIESILSELDPDFDGLSEDQKTKRVYQEIKEEIQDRKISEFKEDPEIRDFVERLTYDGMTWAEAKKKGYEKNIKAENDKYRTAAQTMISKKAKATVLFEQQNASALEVLTEQELSDLTVVEAKDRADMEKIILEGVDPKSAEYARGQRLINKLRSGKVNGAIHNGKYIVFDKDAAQANLDAGILLQGTMISHEIGHSVDDLAFTKPELKNYVTNLASELESNHPRIHNGAIDRLTKLGIYDSKKDMNSQSDKFYDEYSQSAQDILFDPDNRAELNKALGKGQSARNKFKSMVNGSYDIRSGKDALTYLANYIDGFQKGKLSQISKRRIANTNKDTKARSEQRSRTSENVGPEIDKMAVVKNPDGTPKTRNGKEVRMTKPEFESVAKKVYDDIFGKGLLDNLIGAYIPKYDKPPGWTTDSDFISDTYLELRNHIMSFDPSEGDSLFAWTNSFLKFKAGNTFRAIDKAAQGQFTVDLDNYDAMNVESGDDADVLVNNSIVESSDIIETPLLDNIKLDQDSYDNIINEITTIIGTKLPDLSIEFSGNKKISPFVAELKKSFGVKNGPIHKAILKAMGGDVSTVDAFLTNPKNLEAIYEGIPGAWFAKNFPKAAVKSVNGTRVANPDTDGKTNIFTPNYIKDWEGKKIDRHNAADEGLYRGVTSGPPVIKTNPDAMTDITPADIRRKFVNGETMTDIRRNGLDALAMTMAQEIGMEVLSNDLANNGDLTNLFEGRQELFDRVLTENYTQDALNQLSRKDTRLSENPDEIQSGALGLALIANDNGIDSEQFRLASESVDGQTVDLVKSIFELNSDLDGGNNGFIKLISLSKDLPQAFKDKVKRKEYNWNKNKKYVESVSDVFADQIEAFGLSLDSRFLANMTDASVLGFHYRVLDAAKKKQNGEPGRYRAQMDAILANENFNPDLGFEPTDIRPMNKDAAWFGKINKDIFSETNIDTALANLENLRIEIENANEANIESLVYLQKELNKSYKSNKKGTATDSLIYQIHQAQTNLAMGMRAQSTLDYVYIEAGNQMVPSKPSPKTGESKADFYNSAPYKNFVDKLKTVNNYQARFDVRLAQVLNGEAKIAGRKVKLQGVEAVRAANNLVHGDLTIKGEHIGPNSNTMFDLAAMHINDTFTEQGVRDALADHRQFFGPTYLMDIIDSKLGKVSREGDLRITKGLPSDVINNIYHTSGRKALDVITEKQQAKAKYNSLNVASPDVIANANTLDGAIEASRASENVRGISVLDFDDTLATTKSNILYTAPDGTKGKLTAEEFAKQGADLLAQGYVYDFSEFNKVVEGKTAPLFNKALKLAGKFGTDNMFVLTARPAEAAVAISQFLKANGLDIPLKNITGLGNSTAEAKAMWVAGKFSEGYNDFYFADDAIQNVKAVDNILEQLDVKRKVQQARLSENVDLSARLNGMIERKTGVESFKTFSEATAMKRGQDTGKFNVLIPPSAEDFKGLLYQFLGKGKQGDTDLKFFQESLLRPFARADREINSAKQQVGNEYKALKKAFPDVRKKLGKVMPGTDFTYDAGARVYLWNKNGIDIPGISKSDLKSILTAFKADPNNVAFADALSVVSKQKEGYVMPGESWTVETIASDLDNVTNKIGRKKFLAEFVANREAMFGKWNNGKLVGPNMNKIEALYGGRFREALTDILWRMENGTNRAFGAGRLTNQFSNWVNNSVGAIMFLNARSAVLQTLSTVNFVNWSDNNPAKAAMAFANQPQFWRDFSTLFNSDMLKQRRSGLKTDVNQAEIANAVAGSKNKAKAAFAYMIKIGFTPTQIADSFAIASGGATFYRNRIKTYLDQGMSKADAESKAFIDFQEIAEETQQSSRPDLISQQQASPLGRLVLAFANTPMQYARLTKKAILDLKDGRGDVKTNISKILYYGAVQNVIFSALQKSLFALAFDDEEDDEAKAKKLEDKSLGIINSMADSLLRGMGIGGAAVSTAKNMIIEFHKQNQKGWNADFDQVVYEFLSLSPPIGSKARKLKSGLSTYQYNKDVIKEMETFDIDNPLWYTVGKTISATTNIPLDRAVNKIQNIKAASDSSNEAWQRVALGLGWNTWDVGADNPDILAAQKRVEEGKRKAREEKKESKSKDNKQGSVRCSSENSDGDRCGNITRNKAGLCYAHD